MPLYRNVGKSSKSDVSFFTLFLISGAIDYCECSSLEGTGLDDIVQAAVSVALDHSTRKTFNWPCKRCISYDQTIILFLLYILLDIIKAI